MNSQIIQDLFDLSGKVALITGAARGIGKAISLLLAQAGANVVLADIDLADAQRTAEEIETLGGKTLTLETDVSSEEQISVMVEAVVHRFKHIDILVNNAGIFPPASTIFDLSSEDWDRVFDLNTRGLFLTTKSTARMMARKEQGGKVVNIASFEGVKPFASGMAHYEASKAAVIMLTRSLARSLAKHNINVNAVAPGVIDTEGLRATLGPYGTDPVDAFGPIIPLRRLGTPEDISQGVLFLVSRASDYITGECLFIDGGIVHV